MTVLYLGDIPADPFAVAPPDGLALSDFTLAEASLVAPSGDVVPVEAEISVDIVLVDVGPTSPFDEAGLWRIRIVVSSATARATFPDARLVIDDPDSEWHTLATARDEWPGSKTSITDVKLHRLLEIARRDCLTWGPELVDAAGLPLPVPGPWLEAQLKQARNILNAAQASTQQVDPDMSSYEPRPMDWWVKQLIRPDSGRPILA